MIMMSSKETSQKKGQNLSRQTNYYICKRCGYISIVSNPTCPICIKENIQINLIKVFDYEN
jgi:rubrerythrin